jgi:hypothetical protein
MAFYLLHAGTALQKSTVAGVLTTLTLPAGVTMVSTRPARFAILANSIVVVNAVSVNIAVNPADLSTRLLSITAPSAAATAAAGIAGVLNGSYRFAYTYAITSGETILTESPMSPVTGPISVVNRKVDLSGVTTSGTAGVTKRIIYQTTAGGTTWFEADRIDDNVATTITLNTSDFDLALLESAEPKGNPPGVDTTDRFRLIVSWKDRLFASPANKPDYVYVSGNREISSWAESRRFTVKTEGEDATGVTAFMARRDELVIAKRRKLWKLIGTSPDDFEQVLIADGIGCVSQDAAIVIRDTCYFLGEDGFYEYGTDGVKKLSREKVQPWFTTDDYFNRAYFSTAFCKYNQLYDKVELHLAAVGATTINRWVEYDLKQKEWFGIHKTDAFTPTCAGAMDDANGFSTPVIGASNSFIYRQNQSTGTDAGTAIDMDITTKFHSGNTPDILHYWGEPSVLTKIEDMGTLKVTPTVGDLDASAQDVINLDLTDGRHRLPRLGYGRFLQLRFQNAENNQDVTIYGYELPMFEVGRR